MPGKKGEALRRRSLLLAATSDWLRKGRNERVGRRAISIALKPSFQTYTPDAGSGMRIHIVRGLLSDEELEQFTGLWNDAKILLMSFNPIDWKNLLDAINDWIYPDTAGAREVPQKTREIMRSMAARMVTDIVSAAPSHPGIQQWARDLREKLLLNIEIPVDPNFETLFPKFNRKDLDNLEEVTQKQRQQVMALAENWRHQSSGEITREIARLEEAATVARSVRNRWTPLLCECLAIDLSNPKEWLEHFIVTGLPAELGAPFLRKVVTDRMDGWEESIAQCFGDPRYERIATYLILSLPDVNNELLAEAGIHAGSYPEMVETMCLWQQVPDRTLKFLLSHENLLISTHAAVGEWCAILKGEVSISEEWKQAILKAEGHEFWIAEILKGDKALAFDWVIRRIQDGSSLVHFFVVNELKAAISVLDSNQRLAVLHHINVEGYSTSVLISELGKEDLQVYAAILKEPRFSKYHLASLGGHPTELWAEKVIRAISAGYSPDQIANSTLHYDNSWSGDESAMWQRWIDDFNSFRTHPDPGVCSVAELGITKALQRQALAAEEEHREAVYGI